jgi:plasmid stabilization system protein ParE
MRPVRVGKRAQADLLAASQWYEHERIGLGVEYLAVIDATLANIARAPGAFRPRYGEMRMVITPRFPFLICFVWNEKEDFISVRRILHAKRDMGPLLGDLR